MINTIIYRAVACIFVVTPAYAENHTVSWYVAHPAEMRQQLSACFDDPGHAKHVANCENALSAQDRHTLVDARSHLAQLNAETDNAKIRAWQAHPDQLLNKLKICNQLPAQVARQATDCVQAFAVAEGLHR
jgi:hypothetical protein